MGNLKHNGIKDDSTKDDDDDDIVQEEHLHMYIEKVKPFALSLRVFFIPIPRV